MTAGQEAQNGSNRWDGFSRSRIASDVEGFLSNQPAFAKYRAVCEDSVKLIDEIISRNETDKWCLAFNGGKDCTVLLHLIVCCLLKKRLDPQVAKMRAFYFQSKRPFQAIDDFVEETKSRYGIAIVTLKGGVRESCFELKRLHPHIEFVFMGTRQIDLAPHGKVPLDFVAKTDAGWPAFLRVSPLLRWDYASVWLFLRELKVPYCKLYDEGYTSLGDYEDTIKNPQLKIPTQNGLVEYKPAYQLQDGSFERASRIKKTD